MKNTILDTPIKKKPQKLFNQLFLNIVVFVALVLVIFSLINLSTFMGLKKEYSDYKSSNATNQAIELFKFHEEKLFEYKKILDWRMRRVNNFASSFFVKNEVNTESFNDFCEQLKIDRNTEGLYIIDSKSGDFLFGNLSEDKTTLNNMKISSLNFKKQGVLHEKLFEQLIKEKQYHNIGFAVEHHTGKLKLMAFQLTKDEKYLIYFTIYDKQISGIVEDIRWKFTHHSKGLVATELFVNSDTAIYTLSGKRILPQVRLFLNEVATKKKEMTFLRDITARDFDDFIVQKSSSTDLNDLHTINQIKKLQFQFIPLKQNSLLDKYIVLIITDVSSNTKKLFNDIIIYILFFLLSVGIIVIIIYFSIKKIVLQITDLVKSINGIISGNFNGRATVRGDNEIAQLSENFNLMLNTIENNYTVLEQKVIERTAEISQKKNEIERQKISIEKSRNLLEKTNEDLNHANNEISIRKKEIEDSILYAKRIQTAILPSKDLIKRLLPDSFVVFMPRDVVSGDFYWVAEASNKVYFAAVDCTGHGVPGAFMSMVGYNQLNYIIKSGFTKPSDILNELNFNVVNLLNQGGSDKTVVRDGMDISLCCLDPVSLILEFAAAFNPLLIIRNKEVIIIEADKFPIGNYVTGMDVKKFVNQTVQLYKGDCLYVFSDGVTDQFGGEKGKKFMMKKFKETMIECNDKDGVMQGQFLKSEIINWMGTYHQIDDILIFGVKI